MTKTTTTFVKALPNGSDPGNGSKTQMLDQCLVCMGSLDGEGDMQMLLCDFRKKDGTCDKTMHLKCAGLSRVPSGPLFCKDCPQGFTLGGR